MATSEKSPKRARGDRTRAVHGAREGQHGPMSTPLNRSSTFGFPSLEAMNAEQALGRDGAFYQRTGHPTVRAAERHLAEIEGADDALLFSSGIAAIAAAFMAHLQVGDHVVALHQSYGGTHDLLRWGEQHFGWQVECVDARTPSDWARAFRPQTKLLHIESPTNPNNVVVDIAAASKLAHSRGALLSVDNTFASPLGQHPGEWGADMVEYSATKSIGGHSDLMAGAVTGSRDLIDKVWKIRKVFGAIPAPEVASQIERSLKTLALRIVAQNATALELAEHLSSHPGVRSVSYPGLKTHPGHALAAHQMMHGFGPIVAIEVMGGGEAARATVEALRLVHHAPSLGSAESLVSLPAFTSHLQLGPEGRERAGIAEGLIRLSVGLEDAADLRADLDQALAKAAAKAPAATR
jgi:cystathionine gamma-synthase